MQVKLVELRDRMTFVGCVAMSITGHDHPLCRRLGFAYDTRCVLFGRIDGGGKLEYDPYAWGDRTFHAAHLWLEQHFDELPHGGVLDVEFILGETTEPKPSELEPSPELPSAEPLSEQLVVARATAVVAERERLRKLAAHALELPVGAPFKLDHVTPYIAERSYVVALALVRALCPSSEQTA